MKIFFVLLFLIFWGESFAQKIKFRLEIGNQLGFSQKKDLILFGKLASMGYSSNIPAPEYSLEVIPAYEFIKLPNFGFILEYELNKKLFIQTGFYHNEDASFSYIKYFWLSMDGLDSNGYKSIYLSNSSLGAGIVIHKIPIIFSWKINKLNNEKKRSVLVTPLIGCNYIWSNYKNRALDDPYFEFQEMIPDYLYGGSIKTKDQVLRGNKTRGVSLLFGLNLRLYNKKREWIGLNLYFEKGFNVWGYGKFELWRNQKYFENTVITRGSGLHFKISVPIDIYNFEKHRKK